ncbi:hypothetical protein GCM10027024_30390 [Microbacterium insulae]
MKKQRTLQSITAATALALVAALLPLGATASASAHVGVRQVSPQIAGPIIVKHFWSGILRLFHHILKACVAADEPVQGL